MDTNPKKSKAFIITFIIILLLLIVGYFVYKNSDQLFGTKGSTGISKIFAPLFGTSKPKSLNTINTTDTNTNGNNTTTQLPVDTNTGNTGNGNTNNTTGSNIGIGQANIVPPFNPLPTPVQTGVNCADKNGNPIVCGSDISNFGGTQCSDGIDNDNDHLIDTADPGCHTDFTASNTLSYDARLNNESLQNNTAGLVTQTMCPDDPLVFTEDEKASLAVLLRQYYLLAPILKNEDDVTLLDYDNTTNEELVKQANILINDCNTQKADPAYTGPREVKDNPYYQRALPNTNAQTYLPNFKPIYTMGSYPLIGWGTYGICGGTGIMAILCSKDIDNPNKASLYELMFNIW